MIRGIGPVYAKKLIAAFVCSSHNIRMDHFKGGGSLWLSDASESQLTEITQLL